MGKKFSKWLIVFWCLLLIGVPKVYAFRLQVTYVDVYDSKGNTPDPVEAFHGDSLRAKIGMQDLDATSTSAQSSGSISAQIFLLQGNSSTYLETKHLTPFRVGTDQEFSFRIPNVLPGIYRLKVVVICENSRTGAAESLSRNRIEVYPDGVNLKLSANISPSSANIGDRINVRATTLENIGNMASERTKLSFYLGSHRGDTSIPLGSRDLGRMGPRSAYPSVSYQTDPIPHIAAGNYWVTVKVESEGQTDINPDDNVVSNQIEIRGSASSAPPDLIITDLQITPWHRGKQADHNYVLSGDEVEVKIKIKNQGSGAVYTPFNSRIYLGTRRGGKDYLIAEIRHNELIDAGQEKEFTQKGFSIPTMQKRTYYLTAEVDTGDEIAEFNENNNVFASSNTLTVTSPPDLAVDNIQFNPGSVKPGDRIEVTFTVHNYGGYPVEKHDLKNYPGYINFYLGSLPNRKDFTIATGCTLPEILNGHSSVTLTCPAPIPINTSLGNYFVAVEIPESKDEELTGNNIFSSEDQIQITPLEGKVLRVEKVYLPNSTVTQNTSFNVVVWFENQGSDTIDDQIPIEIYLAEHPPGQGSGCYNEVKVKEVTRHISLRSGQKRDITISGIPVNVEPGEYCVIASSSLNNQGTSGHSRSFLRVLSGGFPDLVPTDITLTNNCRIQITLKNLGLGSIPDEFYKSNIIMLRTFVDGSPYWDQIPKNIDENKSLKDPNGTLIFTIPWTPISSGSHIIRVIVDPENALQEAHETNNELYKRVTCGGLIQQGIRGVKSAFTEYELRHKVGLEQRNLGGARNELQPASKKFKKPKKSRGFISEQKGNKSNIKPGSKIRIEKGSLYYPDLTITNIRKLKGCIVEITVKNSGGPLEESFYKANITLLKITEDTGSRKTLATISIGQGDPHKKLINSNGEVKIKWTIPSNGTTNLNNTLKFIVDPNKAILEKNERNNVVNMKITCTQGSKKTSPKRPPVKRNPKRPPVVR